MPWIGGARLVVERGMTGATGNLYCGLHEFADMALLLHYFGGGPGLFLDVGANIGSYTILAAKARGAKVIAVEPAPLSGERLLLNLAVNQIQNLVEFHRVAVGAVPGKVWFSMDCDTTNQVVDESYPGTKTKVEVQTLDTIVAGRSAGFWKVDVEGFETAVLQGAESSLADPGVEVVLLEGNDPAIIAIMMRHGFQLRQYDPWNRKLNIPGAATAGGNHIWVRRPDTIEDRCRQAPPLDVFGVLL